MAKDIETRLALLETLPARFDRIITYMEKGEAYRIDTSTKLAVIINNQDQFKEYTDKCDVDRKGQDNRINSLENTRSRQTGMVAGVSFTVTGIGALIGWAIEHWGKA